MKKLIPFSAVLVLSSTLHAESLEEKKFWKDQTDYVNEKLASANEQCSTKFSFDWVDKATLRDQTKKHGHSPNGVCGEIIAVVESICRSGDDGKQAVKAKIKGFTCGYAQPRALDLKGGIVKYMGNNEESNFNDWAQPWLEKHL